LGVLTKLNRKIKVIKYEINLIKTVIQILVAH
jgi:hypothetical protein